MAIADDGQWSPRVAGASLCGIDADQLPPARPVLQPSMAERQEHQSGVHAPSTGHYEELNVFGTRTGRVEQVREGERLPEGPRGFTWRQIEDEGC